jgi:hypothetical protein
VAESNLGFGKSIRTAPADDDLLICVGCATDESEGCIKQTNGVSEFQKFDGKSKANACRGFINANAAAHRVT